MCAMTKAEVLAHYRSTYAVAAALGIKQPSVMGWGEYPPALRQLQLETLTGGMLKAEAGCHAPAAPTPETTAQGAA